MWPSLIDLASDVNCGKVKSVDLVKKALKKIEEDKSYNAIISVNKNLALEKAKKIDESIKNGVKVGSLAGIPFIAKDNFLTIEGYTTAASNVLKNYRAVYQSTAVNLLESQGAICIAKSNMDAFAHGSSTENSDFFTTSNPYDKKRVPGGSSGGSATSVALNMSPFSIGTDTGGSIRQPASFCGVVGYKPTYGLVSRSGVVAMASSTDTIGTITSNVSDAIVVMDIISGQDELDSTTLPSKYKIDSNKIKVIKKAKIGIIKEYLDYGLDDQVREGLSLAIAKLKNAGYELEEVSIKSLPLALAVYYILCPAEVSSNLSRYDGQRYGYSEANSSDLESSYVESRTNGFGKEAKRRIMIGTYVLSSGYYEAYYKKAQLVRTKLINEFNEVFNKYDFLIGPTVPTVAFEMNSKKDPLEMYLNDIMTVAVNLVGIPAISLPVPLKNSLPVGVQLMANQKKDNELLSLALSVEEILKS